MVSTIKRFSSSEAAVQLRNGQLGYNEEDEGLYLGTQSGAKNLLVPSKIGLWPMQIVDCKNGDFLTKLKEGIAPTVGNTYAVVMADIDQTTTGLPFQLTDAISPRYRTELRFDPDLNISNITFHANEFGVWEYQGALNNRWSSCSSLRNDIDLGLSADILVTLNDIVGIRHQLYDGLVSFSYDTQTLNLPRNVSGSGTFYSEYVRKLESGTIYTRIFDPSINKSWWGTSSGTIIDWAEVGSGSNRVLAMPNYSNNYVIETNHPSASTAMTWTASKDCYVRIFGSSTGTGYFFTFINNKIVLAPWSQPGTVQDYFLPVRKNDVIVSNYSTGAAGTPITNLTGQIWSYDIVPLDGSNTIIPHTTPSLTDFIWNDFVANGEPLSYKKTFQLELVYDTWSPSVTVDLPWNSAWQPTVIDVNAALDSNNRKFLWLRATSISGRYAGLELYSTWVGTRTANSWRSFVSDQYQEIKVGQTGLCEYVVHTDDASLPNSKIKLVEDVTVDVVAGGYFNIYDDIDLNKHTLTINGPASTAGQDHYVIGTNNLKISNGTLILNNIDFNVSGDFNCVLEDVDFTFNCQNSTTESSNVNYLVGITSIKNCNVSGTILLNSPVVSSTGAIPFRSLTKIENSVFNFTQEKSINDQSLNIQHNGLIISNTGMIIKDSSFTFDYHNSTMQRLFIFYNILSDMRVVNNRFNLILNPFYNYTDPLNNNYNCIFFLGGGNNIKMKDNYIRIGLDPNRHIGYGPVIFDFIVSNLPITYSEFTNNHFCPYHNAAFVPLAITSINLMRGYDVTYSNLILDGNKFTFINKTASAPTTPKYLINVVQSYFKNSIFRNNVGVNVLTQSTPTIIGNGASMYTSANINYYNNINNNDQIIES